MKNLFITILFTAISTAALAQAPEKLDPQLYAFPKFEEGIVTYNTGERSSGKINIYLIDQSVRVLDSDGVILLASNNDAITRVSVGNRLFYVGRDGWIEILSYSDDIFFGVIRSTTVTDNAKKGAYGTVSTTTSIDSYSYGNDGGQTFLYRSIADLPENHLYREIPCFYRNGAQLNASKKSFLKCFPKQKDFIEEYLKENPVNFGKLDEVKTLFLLLKDRQK